MRIINAVGPTTSSLSPSFSATRITDLSFFHVSPRIRCRVVPVNKRFPWSSTLQEDHHRANRKRTSSYSFNRSSSISPLLAQSHSHSSLSLLFFFFLLFTLPSLLFLVAFLPFISAARGFLEFQTAFQHMPPDHRPLSISCSGTQTRSCGPALSTFRVQPGIRGPRPPRSFLQLTAGTGYVKHCSRRVQEERISRKLRR